MAVPYKETLLEFLNSLKWFDGHLLIYRCTTFNNNNNFQVTTIIISSDIILSEKAFYFSLPFFLMFTGFIRKTADKTSLVKIFWTLFICCHLLDFDIKNFILL